MKITTFTVTTALAFLVLMPGVRAAQALRTPWGDPDLQGIWRNSARENF